MQYPRLPCDSFIVIVFQYTSPQLRDNQVYYRKREYVRLSHLLVLAPILTSLSLGRKEGEHHSVLTHINFRHLFISPYCLTSTPQKTRCPHRVVSQSVFFGDAAIPTAIGKMPLTILYRDKLAIMVGIAKV